MLKVNEIFYSIQGEGPFVGFPAVFVRLSGCNLSCSFCDTDFTNYVEMPIQAIVQAVRKHQKANQQNLVIITGGEPMLQASQLPQLLHALFSMKCIIQIETNGTLEFTKEVTEVATIVCSPKWSGKTLFSSPGVVQSLRHLDCVKYVLKSGDSIPEKLLPDFYVPVYIQPMDEKDPEKNKANMDYAVELCLKNGWNLSLQMQKILNIK